MSLMEMSFSGAVLVLVILAVRAALKNRLPKITFTALWMVALLRMLVPFSLSSAWSVYTFLPDVDSIIGQAWQSAQVVYEKYADEGVMANFSNTSLLQKINEAGNIGDFIAESEKPSIVGTTTHNVPVWNIIWAAGFVMCAAFFSWIYCRCYLEFQMSLPIDAGILGGWYGLHPLKRKLSIRQSDQISSPLSYGIWHPVILLPKSTKWEDGFQLRYVLEHEYVHIQHFDAAIKLLMAAALCVHWFNPLVWLMYLFFNRDLELYCDETVIRRFGEEEKSAYAMTLIEMEEEKSGFIPLGNSFSKNAIEERISAIMKIKKMSLLTWGMAVALVGSITLLFATSCKAYGEAEKTNAADVQEYSIVSEERKEAQVSLQDVEADLEWYDFVEEHYKEYGIQYHLPENRLYYLDTPIRYFYDNKNGGVLWTDKEGQFVLEVIYDKQGEILCLSGGPADSDEAVDEFFTDGAADAVHEASKVAKNRAEEAANEERKAAKGRVREAGAVTVAIENAIRESIDINIAYAISKSKEISEYKKFGISYDKTTGYLMYDGKTIGYFMDETAPGVYTRFVDRTGTLGIIVVRDSGEIVSIESFPFDEKNVSNSIVNEEIELTKKETQNLIEED